MGYISGSMGHCCSSEVCVSVKNVN